MDSMTHSLDHTKTPVEHRYVFTVEATNQGERRLTMCIYDAGKVIFNKCGFSLEIHNCLRLKWIYPEAVSTTNMDR